LKITKKGSRRQRRRGVGGWQKREGSDEEKK